MRIGELAVRTGVSVSTLRYYEKRGLLSASQRTAGGYREYADADLDRVEVVVAAKSLGFTLQEIHQILEAIGQPDEGRTISRMAEDRLATIKKEIMRLVEIESVLEERLKTWSSAKKAKAESDPGKIIIGDRAVVRRRPRDR
ncbi:MAG: MerR family transcriptional regulator [Armatimonadetes bacterium]|nr:MerR family transcriptional regulator [Armatimonadota bacterium]